MWMLCAVALELFFDCAPDPSQVDSFLPMPWMVRPALREKGWEVSPFVQHAENTWVLWNLPASLKDPSIHDVDWDSRPREKMVLFMWEPPAVQPELYDPAIQARFGKIYTWNDDLVDNQRFFKFNYPVLTQKIDLIVPFEKKKLCVMVVRRKASTHPQQLYRERERVIRFFEKKPPGEFDLYGADWGKRRFRNYRGPVADKLATIKNYKFSICYENMRDIKGYISEKIFDCFAAGTVPVYWGASNITDAIPPECFIDRRKFKDDRALYRFLKRMKKEDYQAYLDAADRFLKSEQAQQFSSDQFAKTFLTIINPSS